MSRAYLVDTHVWIWYARGDRERIGRDLARRLQTLDEQGALHVSVISAWEIGLLDAKGRIRLGMPIREWMDTFFQRTCFRLLRLDLPIALAANQLPGELHPDPADRLLVATARHHELTLLTEDRKILDYARQGYVRARRCGDKGLLK